MAAVLGGSCLLVLSIFVVALLFKRPIWPDLILSGGFFAIYAGFIIWLFLATKYQLSESEMIVHAGLYKVTIPFQSIQSVVKSNNPLAGPAFSLDRLEITYENTKTILISPKNQDQFLADIGWDTAGRSEGS